MNIMQHSNSTTDVSSLPKVIVLLGPTASGKTDWALRMAKAVDGEIISADSRQVYKKMDIGTAKPKGEWRWQASRRGLFRTFFVDDVPHHLIDIVDPGKPFTVAEFRDLAIKHVKVTDKQGHVPIVAGGTGLYISALVDNWYIPRVPANKKLRESLEEQSVDALVSLLEKIDPASANAIDRRNKRRVVRALEVAILTGDSFVKQKKKGEPIFSFFQIGIDVPRDELYERIDRRIEDMIQSGLVDEIAKLLKQKYSWQLPSMSGVGYRQFRDHLEGQGMLEEAIAKLKKETRQFARRQMTWFRRDKRILWCKTYEEAFALVEAFLRGRLTRRHL